MSEAVSAQDVEEQKLSQKWQDRFELLRKIGADKKFIFEALKSSEFNSLSPKDKRNVSFNFIAFLFEPLYYFSKKMWLKGSFILGCIWLFNGIISLFGMLVGTEILSFVAWIATSVVCSILASYDYFRFVTKGEKFWPELPKIFTLPQGYIGFPTIALFFFLATSGIFSGPEVPTCSSKEATDLVLQISNNEVKKTYGSQLANAIDFSVSAIRTTDVNDQTGAYSCAAQLDMSGLGGVESSPITYTIEMTDGGDEFYVNVFGL